MLQGPGGGVGGVGPAWHPVIRDETGPAGEDLLEHLAVHVGFLGLGRVEWELLGGGFHQLVCHLGMKKHGEGLAAY